MRFDGTDIEKVRAYALRLARLLPRSDGGEDIEIVDEMLRPQAYRIDQAHASDASLTVDETLEIPSIHEFGVRG